MSDVVDFLEHMGQDARLRDASQTDFEKAIADAGLDPELEQVIVARDRVRLEALLGVQPICSMMIPGKEDEEEERQHDEDDEQKGPSPDDEVASLHSELHYAAR